MTRAIVLYLARADNGVIGRGGALPWRLPADLKRFKAMTMGKPMLMGRKTFDSFPGVLPGRRHIVLTRDAGWVAKGAEVAHSIGEALALAGDAAELAVIGGAEIYRLMLPHATRIELTQVHLAPTGDAFVPPFDPGAWRETARAAHPGDGGGPAFDFVTLVRA